MKDLLSLLAQRQTLSFEQTVQAFELVMSGQATPAQIGALLAMMQLRGPTEAELAGAAWVMRRKVTAVSVPEGLIIVDTCGTGGDHAGTFNISTAAALVVAAAGRPHGVAVAKHGNRSVTSQSGSSQVLQSLGVKLKVQPETLSRCLDHAGLCFCFAPVHHPAMKHAAPVRAELGFRTLFNLLGPLTNPAGAKRQVIGVFDPALTEPLARVLQRLGSHHALVVHGSISKAPPNGTMKEHGMDELSICGPSRLSELKNGMISTRLVRPEELGLALGDPHSLSVESPQASAQVIRQILSGHTGPPRDIVALNAAAGLVAADLAEDLRSGLRLACQAIDSGAAEKVLVTLVNMTQADPTPED